MRTLSLALSALLAAEPCLAALRPGGPIGRIKSLGAPAVAVPALPATELAASLRARAELPGALTLAQAPERPSALLPARLAALSLAAAADAARAANSPAEAVSGLGEGQVRRLQGDWRQAAGDGGPPVVVPPQGRGLDPLPESQRRKTVRRMVAGTMAFKLGMEAMTTAVPFVAMQSLGGAAPVALLVVGVYGTAQALASSWIGSWTRSLPAARVLALAVLAQGGLVAAALGLAAAHMLSPYALFAIYGMVGLCVGAAETSRRLVPALVLGHDEDALRGYNARLHRYYEMAGVAGAALTGLAIWKLGALAAMTMTPPVALLAAWLFWGVSHPRADPGPSEGVAQAWRELGRAARLIVSDPRLRVVAAAMVLPQVVHRIFENLILPVYAKGALRHEALSAALLTASNLGELIGASLLLKFSARLPGPYHWVRWGAYGLLAAWALWLAPALGLSGWASLGLLLPTLLIFSMSWAGSHLSLESDLQNRVDSGAQPRVVGLVYAAFVITAALASVLVGRVFDAMGLLPGLVLVCGAFTALAVALWVASRRLR